MQTFALVLDLFVVALLVPTIVFAVILNNRLSVLRKNKEELARLIAAFNEATVRAEGGIPKLRKSSEEAGRAIQEKMERAHMLRDDLAFMVERADTMATRLEEAVRAGRGDARAMPVGAATGKDIESAAEARERAAAIAERAGEWAKEEGRDAGRGGAPSETAPDAMDQGRGFDRPAVTTRPNRDEAERIGRERIAQARAALTAEREDVVRPRRSQSLAAGLSADEGAAARPRDDDERSEAERELLRALQSAR